MSEPRRPVDSAAVVRIVTWNVNSLKARLPRVEQWLAENRPEIVCLQETKMKDEAFPAEVFDALGYESVHHGQGQWNGVAILSTVGIDDVVSGWDDDGPEDTDARVIWATCVFRRHHDEGGLYSFWDYRGGDFHQGRGLRIDLIMATASLASRSADARVDRDARKGEKPSDHAPVIAEFD